MRLMKQRGDTLVEVLLAMSVIGLILGSSYAIANRSLATGRNAQEQTEAVKLAESQLEFLKAYIDEDPSGVPAYSGFAGFRDASTAFCVIPDTNTLAEGTDCAADVNGTTLYNLFLVYSEPTASGGPEHFQSIVTWDRLNSTEDGEVRLLYRP